MSQAAIIAWMRERVTETAIRWEVVNQTICVLAIAVTLVNLSLTGYDLWRQTRSGRNGGTSLIARREFRVEAFRFFRLLCWFVTFIGFLVNSPHTVLFLALLVPLYFVTEGADSVLNTVSRLAAWRYLETEVAREQAEARASVRAADAARRVEQVRLTLEATNAATGEKLDVIHDLVNSRLTEALQKIDRLEARLLEKTGEAPTGEPPRKEGPQP